MSEAVAATPSVKIVKQSTWRGSARLWSNRYHFNGGVPADTAHWLTLFDAIVAAEKLCLQTTTSIVHAWAYAAGSDVPVADKPYTQPGSISRTTDIATPLQTAALIRWATTARSTKNHPVYLFSFMHDILAQGNSTPDTLSSAQKTPLETYATAWMTGFSDGTITAVRAGPNGATGVSRVVDTFVTHRDFPT